MQTGRRFLHAAAHIWEDIPGFFFGCGSLPVKMRDNKNWDRGMDESTIIATLREHEAREIAR